ncbi:aldehyde oxidoreductase [Halarchaeum grantii]|uniref:Aldehyde oxidoreductase n=1 Tax=Halarchaeum grantii TaxID=1193105 RepID=A0A830EXN6_9EURY|nr:aldehyde oxidoreductase [Halarchaeum grantii]
MLPSHPPIGVNRVPSLGLGTWQNTDTERCAESVRTALEAGYRHVDTAQYYGNEAAVGRGIAAADVDREDVLVATKLHPEQSGLAREQVVEGVEDSLDRLGLDTIDLCYVHWPVGNYDAAETLAAFDELRDRGRIAHVGVSNFDTALLEEAMDVLDAPLVAHQAETHPLLAQDDLIEHAQANDYYHVAYSPLARGEVFDSPVLTDIAEARDVTPAQVSLAWLLSKENVCVVPKATSERHIADNRAALDLTLTADEIARIDAIEREERLVERDGAPWQD